jgi:hypothetical protein
MIVFGVSVSAVFPVLTLFSRESLSIAILGISGFVVVYVLLVAFKAGSRLRTLLSNISFGSLLSHPGLSSYIPWTDFDLVKDSFAVSSVDDECDQPPPAESPSPTHRVPDWLGDALVDSYVRWREESVAVRNASFTWRSGATNSTLACAIYEAALDREEAAARDYALCSDHVRRYCI